MPFHRAKSCREFHCLTPSAPLPRAPVLVPSLGSGCGRHLAAPSAASVAVDTFGETVGNDPVSLLAQVLWLANRAPA
jgi:hypothetical protein